jgi:glycosyltransferase involved in cell wall biosynthesis
MSSQYDALVDLEIFEFSFLYINEKQRNPAWPPVYPKRISYEFLPQPKLPWPASMKYRLNTNITPVLDRHDFDAMILHGFYDSSAAWQSIRWCRKNNRPYLIRCDANVTKEKGFLRRLSRKILISKKISDAGALLYIGTQNKKYYQLYGARNEQLFLTPWEIDYDNLEVYYKKALSERLSLRSHIGVRSNECVIITVSRLLSWKGYDNLIPVIYKLTKDNLPVRLIIVGEGPYRNKMEEMISEYNAPIHLLGHLDREGVINSLVSSDIFVLPSNQEPWGLVVNEAAFCGLPLVLSSAVGAGSDLLKTGENGYIFETGNQNSLYQYLHKLVLDKSLREEMGQKSLEIITNWRQQNHAISGYEKALKHALKIEERC